MISEKHINKEDFLGIANTVIPWEYFKGIYSIDGIIFTDDHYLGIQFYYSEEHKGCFLATTNKTQYVTKEDLKNDKWFIISHVLGEVNTQFMSIQETLKDDPYTIIFNRYQSGETGLLEYEKVEYNDKGEYMKVHKSFDTRPHPKDDIQGTLLRHINFVYWHDAMIPMMERNVFVKTNSENIRLLKEIMIKPQFEIMKANNMLSKSFGQDFNKLKFNQVHFPPFGAMEFVEDETIEDFIITKK